jgi:hypothetical protein
MRHEQYGSKLIQLHINLYYLAYKKIYTGLDKINSPSLLILFKNFTFKLSPEV